MQSFSFPPAANKDAKILILGTMPGKKSLEMKEYYAYKYNVFWKIMFTMFNNKFSVNYDDKINLLINNNIALWDSLKYCYRESSADSDITDEIPNNFSLFYKEHPSIKNVFFNGSASANYYKKYVGFDGIRQFHILPSTSPANARMSFDEKYQKWSIIKEILRYE